MIRHTTMDEAEPTPEGAGGAAPEAPTSVPEPASITPTPETEKPVEGTKPPVPEADPMATLMAMVEALKAQVSGLTETNTTLASKATEAQAAADKAASEARKTAFDAALTRAGIVGEGPRYARVDLGDLDLAEEAAQVKLSEWVKGHSQYFGAKGTPAVQTPPADQPKPHKFAAHMMKMFGGG